jgi:hypothetical protein
MFFPSIYALLSWHSSDDLTIFGGPGLLLCSATVEEKGSSVVYCENARTKRRWMSSDHHGSVELTHTVGRYLSKFHWVSLRLEMTRAHMKRKLQIEMPLGHTCCLLFCLLINLTNKWNKKSIFVPQAT